MKNLPIKHTFESLNKHLSISIVDDNPFEEYKISKLRQKFGEVEYVQSDDNIIELITKSEVLIINRKFTEKIFNSRFEWIIDNISLIQGCRLILVSDEQITDDYRKAISKTPGVVFCLDKPINHYYLISIISQIGKEVWYRKIIDTAPEEFMVMDKEGTILLDSSEKKKIFGDDLVGDKCYLRLEERDPVNKLCNNCPSLQAFYDLKGRPVRTHWDFKSRGKESAYRVPIKKQVLDLGAIALQNKTGKNIAIIEVNRNITLQKIAEIYISLLDKKMSWDLRKKLIFRGLREMGFDRFRLYLQDNHKKDLYRFADEHQVSGTKPDQFFYKNQDLPTKTILEAKKPILFKVFNPNPDLPFKPDKISDYIYRVGKNNVDRCDELKKYTWIDLPLFSGEKLIGKIIIDRWKLRRNEPDSYDMYVLGWYGKMLGQIIQNARNLGEIERLQKVDDKIILLNKKLQKFEDLDDLMKFSTKIITRLMQIDMCSIFIYDPKTELLERRMSYGHIFKDGKFKTIQNEDFSNETYQVGDCLTGKSFEGNKPQKYNSIQVLYQKALKNRRVLNCEIIDTYQKLLGKKIETSIFVPLIVDGQKIGVIRGTNQQNINRFGEKFFDDFDLKIFNLLAQQIGLAINRLQLKQKKIHVLTVLSHNVKFTKLKDIAKDINRISRPNQNAAKLSEWSKDLEKLVSKYEAQIDDLVNATEDTFNELENKQPLWEIINDYQGDDRYYIDFKLFEACKKTNKINVGNGKETKVSFKFNETIIRSILNNLIDNAIKYTVIKDLSSPKREIFKPSVIGFIIHHPETEKLFYRIDIISFGKYLDDEEREIIFQDGIQLKPKKKINNSNGHGLHHVATLVNQINGRVYANSTKFIRNSDQVAENVFSIYLPLN